MRKQLPTILLIMTLAVGIANASSLAVNVVPTVTGTGAGLFVYSYEVTNEPSSSDNLFSLAIPITGSTSSFVTPVGWTVDAVFTPGYVVWTSADQSSDLISGQSLLFGFSSPLGPGKSSFLAFGTDPITGFPTGDIDTGTTLSPSTATVTTVPEPSSFIFVTIPFLALALRHLWSNSQRCLRQKGLL